jgi:hypothetical protein
MFRAYATLDECSVSGVLLRQFQMQKVQMNVCSHVGKGGRVRRREYENPLDRLV